MNNLHDIELTNLLHESVDSSIRRAETSFDAMEWKIKTNGVFLFGAGVFGRKILRGLRKIGIEPLGFVDNNKELWDTTIEGCRLYSPHESSSKFKNAIFILTVWHDKIGHPIKEIETKLHCYNPVEVISFFFLFWKYPHVFLPYFSIDLPEKTLRQSKEIQECYQLFQDEKSKKEFIAQIRWRLLADYQGLSEPSSYVHYFHEDLFTLNESEFFIDCGAFDGDTLKNFLSRNQDFKEYYALEPDPINFNKLNQYVSDLSEDIRNKIFVEPFAISNQNKQLKFNSSGSAQSSINNEGNITVDCISIDEYFTTSIPTFIKTDVEGAEPDLIKGATNTIKNHLPILAISVYHQFNHLWKLPLAIKSISDEYRYFLRPHCKASWDLICYAIPKSRCIYK